jgi:hypothetical protein
LCEVTTTAEGRSDQEIRQKNAENWQHRNLAACGVRHPLETPENPAAGQPICQRKAPVSGRERGGDTWMGVVPSTTLRQFMRPMNAW